MLPDCKIQKVHEIKSLLKKNNIVDALARAYEPFQLKSLCYPLDLLKTQGYPISVLMLTLLLLPFLGVDSIHGFSNGAYSHVFEGAKDCLYRLKNNEWINWRKLLYRFNKRYNELADKHMVKLSEEERKGMKPKYKCLTADDSPVNHTGKTIEGISKVHDHSLKCTVLGFKLLVLGYFDGINFRPLDFSLHREGQNRQRYRFGLPVRALKKQYRKIRAKLSAGYERFKELDRDKNSQLISMIKRALKHGYVPDYVLFDAWFCCEKTLKAIRLLRQGVIHIVAACKMGNAKYNYLSKEMSAGQILKTLRKVHKRKPKRCRLLGCYYYTVVVDYKGMEVKLFFVRYTKRSKWRLLLTTQTSLRFTQAMEIYAIRWSIEVFFKEVKQLLGIQKCASRDFDAHIAHTTLTLIQYVMLSLHKRFSDYETIGGLFRAIRDQYIQATIAQRLWQIMISILTRLVQKIECDMELVLQLIIHDNDFRQLFSGMVQLKVQDE